MQAILVVLMLFLAVPALAGDKTDKNKGADKKAADAAPSPDEILKQGQRLEARHEIDAAIDAYKAAAAAGAGAMKGEALARMALLQEVRILGNPSATAQEATAADPAGVWPKVALSRARAREKKADEAKTLAESASAAGAAATAALGFALEAKGDDVAAEAAYRKALTEEAGRPDATIGLARVLRRTGRAAAAEPLLQALLEVAPGAAAAYAEAARVKVALGRVDEAASDAVIAAGLAEEDADTRKLATDVGIAKALAEAQKGGATFAIQDLKTLLEANPRSSDLHVGLARVYLVQRDATNAAAELKEALTLAPNNAEAHFQLGYLNHLYKKDAAASLPDLEKAVELAPDDLEYRAHLGAVLAELQKLDRAETELQKVTDARIHELDESLKLKEEEILEV